MWMYVCTSMYKIYFCIACVCVCVCVCVSLCACAYSLLCTIQTCHFDCAMLPLCNYFSVAVCPFCNNDGLLTCMQQHLKTETPNPWHTNRPACQSYMYACIMCMLQIGPELGPRMKIGKPKNNIGFSPDFLFSCSLSYFHSGTYFRTCLFTYFGSRARNLFSSRPSGLQA